MTTATVDQIVALVRQLPKRERKYLVDLINRDIASEPPTEQMVPTPDPWAALFATMDQIAASPVLAGTRSATAEATESRR